MCVYAFLRRYTLHICTAIFNLFTFHFVRCNSLSLSFSLPNSACLFHRIGFVVGLSQAPGKVICIVSALFVDCTSSSRLTCIHTHTSSRINGQMCMSAANSAMQHFYSKHLKDPQHTHRFTQFQTPCISVLISKRNINESSQKRKQKTRYCSRAANCRRAFVKSHEQIDVL